MPVCVVIWKISTARLPPTLPEEVAESKPPTLPEDLEESERPPPLPTLPEELAESGRPPPGLQGGRFGALGVPRLSARGSAGRRGSKRV